MPRFDRTHVTLYVATAEFSLAYGDDQSSSFPMLSFVSLPNYLFFLIFLSGVQPLLPIAPSVVGMLRISSSGFM